MILAKQVYKAKDEAHCKDNFKFVHILYFWFKSKKNLKLQKNLI